MLEFVQSQRVTIGFALLVGYMLLIQRGEIGGTIAKLWARLMSFAAPPAGIVINEPADSDTADFQALARLQKRFERNKCKEGRAALDTCLTHFFHKES